MHWQILCFVYVFVLYAHVIVTKYWHKVFAGRHLERQEEITQNVCTDFETELGEFNGEDNRVHLLVNFPRRSPCRGW
jgi:REP element-mobilizing transposase RayT